MQIEYEDENVKKLFQDLMDIRGSKGLMKKKIGAELTKAVKKRFIQLEAAENFCIYLMTGLGKPHLLEGWDNCYSIHVAANWRFVIAPVLDVLDAESLKNCDTI